MTMAVKSRHAIERTTGGCEPVFRCAVSASDLPDVADSLRAVMADLGVDDVQPDFVTVHYGSTRTAEDICRFVSAKLSSAAVHGGSSCRGVMTGQGAATSTGGGIGAFAIWDKKGSFGTALVPLGHSPRAAAARAAREALDRAGRPGEVPDLIWLTSAPGNEEQALDGIRDVIGHSALIIGGSSADNKVSGGWSQFTRDTCATDSVVVSVLFPSVPFGYAFENGYAPTDRRGTITEASGRSVRQIDGRPAAQVYAEWTCGRIDMPDTGRRSILAPATLFPLGRLSHHLDGIPFHLLAHPAVAHADGTLDFFADLKTGQDIWLMEGTEESLVSRAARIASLSREQLAGGDIGGALMIYCGGCMLAIEHRIGEVPQGVSRALDGAPFLGVFSFGEQGETLNGCSEHGNLMISCITFGTGAPFTAATAHRKPT